MAILGAVVNEGGFRRHLIFIEDISAGGLKFRSDVGYRRFDRIELLMKLTEESYAVRVEVRHVTQDWFGYVCGVKFMEPDPRLVRQISLLFTNLHSLETAAPT